MAESSGSSMVHPCLMRRHDTQTAFSLPEQKHHHVSAPELSGNTFLVTPQGWILVVVDSVGSSPSNKTYLLDPQAGSRVQLPALEDELPEQCRCILSGTGNHPGGGVLVLDLQSPTMWFSRVGGRRWSKHSYDIGCYDLPLEYCPVPKKRNFFNVAALGGRFFFFGANSNSELGTLDFTDDPQPEARLGAVAIPNIDDDIYADTQQSCIVATYLLESCGELFLATIAFHDFCFDRPGTVRVYTMDFSVPAWRRTYDIGDRAFLLGHSNFAASCSASNRGLKPNTLYWLSIFTVGDCSLHVYSIQDGSFETIMPFENASSSRQKPFWIVPLAA
ncbi:hypothetical protein ACP70R_045067 [Stipagrostis hirtigluma subsp. patula]